jgi:hypothetical protein
MLNAIEVTRRQLISDVKARSEFELIPIEDARFKVFTDFLDEIDVFKNPITTRGSGEFKRKKWSLLGYSANTFRQLHEDEEEDSKSDSKQGYDIKWEYTLFNGLFSDGEGILRASKNDIVQVLEETERFINKTFDRDLINDVSVVRDVQQQLIEQFEKGNLDRLDICIISDMLIDSDKLPNKIHVKSIGIDCRIYYWDMRRWDAMKRSKSKREPINIDFKSNDYTIYKIPFLHKTTGKSIDYFLAIFPADLLADLYDLYNTRLLENNVRVFLSATKKANKGIRQTINGNNGEDAYKFFSFNNGLSATAESISFKDGAIERIEDFQIVNGGQTTASIHYSRKRDKADLREVFVAVKITALKKNDDYSNIVSSISEAANTQSSIAVSDFYANDKQLVLLEQISMKNPAQNELDRNLYYYFERMKGQYSVSKSSQGTKTQQTIWERTYPSKLSFDKLDFARWSNMMNGLPYLVAEGAQKQFQTFMKNTNFQRPELHVGYFKTLVGFGSVYKRIYKLCGTATGKSHLYPSRIIDRMTSQHVPVAASTAIYTASILHLLAEGRLNYWAVFDCQYKVNYSILNSVEGPAQNQERINSDLDFLLEKLIDMVWEQIAKFGGAAAQEKSKKKECWDFVVRNITVSKDFLNELNRFKISSEELFNRQLVASEDNDLRYFKILQILLQNECQVLISLYDISKTNTNYIAYRSTISNVIKKVNQKDHLLPLKRLEEIFEFYNMLVNEGFTFELKSKVDLSLGDNYFTIFEEIFKNKDQFLQNSYDIISGNEDFFLQNEKRYFEFVEVTDQYHINYGTSMNGLRIMSEMISFVNAHSKNQ